MGCFGFKLCQQTVDIAQSDGTLNTKKEYQNIPKVLSIIY